MWKLAGQEFESRLMVGTAQYPSPDVMRQAIEASGCEIITVSLRRQAPGANGGDAFWQLLSAMHKQILPNTAGSRTAREAVNTSRMARELFNTNWVKLEVIADDYTLAPFPAGLLDAATELVRDGFTVFPYTTCDVNLAYELVAAGCDIVMPLAAPIGTGQGPLDIPALRRMRAELPDINLIVDAGIGVPSHACQVMELGFDGVLLNSAVARANDPAMMATAFQYSVHAGRQAFLAGPMAVHTTATPSTPTVGTPFWHHGAVK